VDPDFWYWDAYPAAAYREEGRMTEALAEYGRLQLLAGEEPLFGYAITYARNGREAEAREILGQLETLSRAQYVNPLSIALIYANLGQSDEAFEWLDRAVEDRTVFLFGLVTWADFDPLRTDPRLGQLIERIGVPAPR
jgi:tetratricopeptide (TPR) repeat protein